MKTKKTFSYLTEDELILLVDRLSSKRDKLIALILYETGCTVSELINIKIKNIKFNLKKIIIEDSNRNHNKRKVNISKKLSELIKDYLKELKKNKKQTINSNAYLLQSRQSDQITVKRIQQIISKFKINSNKSSKKITPQLLRYTHIAHAYLKGVNIQEITKQVGLKRSRTIEIFSQLNNKKTAYPKFFNEIISEKINMNQKT